MLNYYWESWEMNFMSIYFSNALFVDRCAHIWVNCLKRGSSSQLSEMGAGIFFPVKTCNKIVIRESPVTKLRHTSHFKRSNDLLSSGDAAEMSGAARLCSSSIKPLIWRSLPGSSEIPHRHLELLLVSR